MIWKCIALCRADNYPYAGLQYFDQCWCGHSYDKYKVLPESSCNTICKDSSGKMCGGSWANSVYRTCKKLIYKTRVLKRSSPKKTYSTSSWLFKIACYNFSQRNQHNSLRELLFESYQFSEEWQILLPRLVFSTLGKTVGMRHAVLPAPNCSIHYACTAVWYIGQWNRIGTALFAK